MELIGTSENDSLDDLNNEYGSIYGLGGDDYLASGTQGGSYLYGGDGNDYLDPFGLRDILTGGSGEDVFSLVAGNATQITDFNSSEDIIGIDIGFFSDLGVSGLFRIRNAEFIYSKKPKSKEGQPAFLFNSSTKTLLLDPDGRGGIAPQPIAIFGGIAPTREGLLSSIVYFDRNYGDALFQEAFGA
jgi:Ca2+-binding RTX toxin-like protein